VARLKTGVPLIQARAPHAHPSDPPTPPPAPRPPRSPRAPPHQTQTALRDLSPTRTASPAARPSSAPLAPGLRAHPASRPTTATASLTPLGAACARFTLADLNRLCERSCRHLSPGVARPSGQTRDLRRQRTRPPRRRAAPDARHRAHLLTESSTSPATRVAPASALVAGWQGTDSAVSAEPAPKLFGPSP